MAPDRGLRAAKGTFTTVATAELQHVAGIGFRPAAVIAWWSHGVAEGLVEGNRGGIGFWAEPASAAIAWASLDDATPTVTGQAADRAALLGLDSAGTHTTMRAELAGFEPDGFSLRWSLPPDGAWTVHFLALGGPQVGARVGWLSSPERTSLTEIDGLDEPADAVFFASTAARGDATPVADVGVGFGAAARSGQAAIAVEWRDRAPLGTIAGAQRTDAAVLAVRGPGGRLTAGSFDPGGARPRLAWEVNAGVAVHACYLALTGIRCSIGAAPSPSRPRRRRVRVGFRPEALLFFSWGLRATREARDTARLSLGAAAGANIGCVAWDDRNRGQPSRTRSRSSTRAAILVADTRTGNLHAAATVGRIGRGGFRLDWTEVDHEGRQAIYVALGSGERSPASGAGRR